MMGPGAAGFACLLPLCAPGAEALSPILACAAPIAAWTWGAGTRLDPGSPSRFGWAALDAVCAGGAEGRGMGGAPAALACAACRWGATADRRGCWHCATAAIMAFTWGGTSLMFSPGAAWLEALSCYSILLQLSRFSAPHTSAAAPVPAPKLRSMRAGRPEREKAMAGQAGHLSRAGAVSGP